MDERWQESEVIARAKSGDAKALEEVLEKLKRYLDPFVSAWVDPKGLGGSTYDDVVARTLDKMSRAFPRIKYESLSALKKYARETATRVIIDLGRKETARDGGVAFGVNQDVAGRRATPSKKAIQRENLAELRAAIQALDALDQEIVDSRLDGEEFQSIARRKDITPNAAKKRYARAIKKLRVQLDDFIDLSMSRLLPSASDDDVAE